MSRSDDSAASAFLDMFFASMRAYATWAGVLTGIGIAAFAAQGFYTYGRAYEGRHKFLIIVRAVSVTYLLVGSLSLFLPIASDLSRSALVAAWALSCALLVGARYFANEWRRLVKLQNRLHPDEGAPVRSVLVIGGAGYIGSILVRQLLERRYRVVVLDALLYGDEAIRSLGADPRLRLIRGDCRDIAMVVDAVQGVDAIVHLAALVGDPACALNEKLTISINVAATRMVAEVAKGAGVRRLVFASTCSVYGVSEKVLDEKSRLAPVSLYARSKIASESGVLELNDHDFRVTVLRFATIFGLSPRPRFDLVVNVLTAMAVRERRMTIIGGEQWRPFVHVADAAEAIVKVLESGDRVSGQVLNVGSDAENYRIADIGRLVGEIVADVTVDARPDVPDPRNYRVSFAKLGQCVGYVPRRTVRSGIVELKRALEDGTIGDFRDRRYSNYATMADDGSLSSLRRDDYWEQLGRLSHESESLGSDGVGGRGEGVTIGVGGGGAK
jgi:nucleoside-diphosphate-sugar epimerase